MKKLAENKHLLIIAMVCALFLNSFGVNAKTENDTVYCLQLKGKININKIKHTNKHYKVELFCESKVVDSLIVKDRKTFTFLLQKNKQYGIRISKAGYVPRIISICTNISSKKHIENFYQFYFNTELLAEEKSIHLNKDALDYPIAVILFNQKLDLFYYSKKYTAQIKQKINDRQTEGEAQANNKTLALSNLKK